MEVPETQYAVRGDGLSIAYQVLGEGDRTIVWSQGLGSHLDLQWTDPGMTRFFRSLASFSRLVLYDKIGTGLSDPIPHVPTVEERMEDIRTVLDTVGVDRAVVFGESEGGPSAMAFAAAYPNRTEALCLYGTFANGQPTDRELAEMGSSRGAMEEATRLLDEATENWGKGYILDLLAPSMANPMTRRGMAMFERASVSPAMARGLVDALANIDVRSILGTISAPTLILHRTGDFVPVGAGRQLAEQIPNAEFVELPGTDHAFWTGDSEPIVREVRRFLTGAESAPSVDRVLATVAFTDIVDSTRRAAEMGDSAWRSLLERHDAIVQSRAQAAGGRVVKSLGDGAFLAFPGPAGAVRCVQGVLEEAEGLGIQLRAGVHTGECEAIGDDLGGLAVHIGARISAQAAVGEVLVSSTVKELVVGSELGFEDRGERELKGVPDAWHVYAVASERRSPAVPIPPAREQMTLADRASVRLARRAPGALRAVARVAQRQAS